MEDRPLAIHTRGLRKVYEGRIEAVRGLDLSVKAGEIFGLLGPNGAGKTTTIEILEGLLEPTDGVVEVLGRRWGERDSQLRQKIGISLQETRLTEKHTVLETLRLFRSFYRKGLEPEEVLALVALEEKARELVGKLSGGQRQRLAVGCALVGDPELLFLDEPTTGLDPQSRRALWDVLRGFRARGCTILITTHYMDEAEKLCDRVAIVDRGRVIAEGTPADLIASLAGEHVIEFSLVNGNDGGAPAPAPALEFLPSIPGTSSVHFEWPHGRLTAAEPHVAIPALLEGLRGKGLHLGRLITRHGCLEDVFVGLTGRSLREGEAAGADPEAGDA